MIDQRTAGYAALALRMVAGAYFLIHAAIKIFVFTPAGTAGFFASLGLPPALAYLVIVWEVAGGLALVLGLWTRLVALAMIPNLLGTIFAMHGAAGFAFTNPNGGWEYPAFWAVAMLALALIGDGPFVLKPTSRLANA